MLRESQKQGSLRVSLEGHQLPPVRSGHLPDPAHCPTRQCSCPRCARGSQVHLPSLWWWAEDSASHVASAPNLTHGGRMLIHPLKHLAPPAKAASACLLCTEVTVFLPGDAFSAVNFQTQRTLKVLWRGTVGAMELKQDRNAAWGTEEARDGETMDYTGQD